MLPSQVPHKLPSQLQSPPALVQVIDPNSDGVTQSENIGQTNSQSGSATTTSPPDKRPRPSVECTAAANPTIAGSAAICAKPATGKKAKPSKKNTEAAGSFLSDRDSASPQNKVGDSEVPGDGGAATGASIASLASVEAPRRRLILELVNPSRIHEGRPRSGNVCETIKTHPFYDANNRNIQTLWQAKHTKFVEDGYTSLIGKVSNELARNLVVKGAFQVLQVGAISFTFQCNSVDKEVGNPEVFVNLGPKSSYEGVIHGMFSEGECTSEVATTMLKNLSMPYAVGKDPGGELVALGYEMLFNELTGTWHAKNLMAILICEAIRFQDDGALARMAMRKVVNLFTQHSLTSKKENNPFYRVFVKGKNENENEKSVIFAKKGGKKDTLKLFFSTTAGLDTWPLSINLDYTSDVEEEGSTSAPKVFEGQRTKSGRVPKKATIFSPLQSDKCQPVRRANVTPAEKLNLPGKGKSAEGETSDQDE